MGKDDSDERKRFFQRAYDLRNTDETRAYYSEWAEVYDKEIGEEKGYRQPERCAKALAEVLPADNAEIMDIGCGTGLGGLALKRAGFLTIDGCDLSPEMLGRAAKTGIYRNLFEANLNEPPLAAEDESYDAATCIGVFSFGHVSPDAIDDILRIIRPGGYLVIGLNDHFYDEGAFPAKLESLETAGAIAILSREHGLHLENVEGSTGWVITSRKS